MMLQEFIKFIPIAEKIIPRRSTIDVIKNVAVSHGFVMATDLEITARMKVDDKRAFLIPLAIIKTVLKSRPKHLEIDLSDENRVKIIYDEKAVSFPSTAMEEYPFFSKQTFHGIGTWSKEGIELLHSQLPYCSTDVMRPALNGVYINQNGFFTSCATDGHVLRLIRNVDMKGQFELEKFEGIIPKRVLQLLPRAVKSKVAVSVSDEYFQFILDDGIEIYARKVESTYPNYQRVLPKDFEGVIAVDKKRFLKLADAAKAFADKKSLCSIFHIKGDALKMEVENSEDETRWETSMPIDVIADKKIDIGLNLGNLEKALKGIDGDKALWKYNDNNSASVIVEEESNHDIMNLLMPIRIAKEEADG